jgi:hypothetical protein
VRFQFRINKVDATLAFHADGNRLELIVIDPQLGEFYLNKEDEIEARDVKLAEALNVHLHGGGWKKVTAVQGKPRYSESMSRGALLFFQT